MSNRLMLAAGSVVLVASACATTADTTTTTAGTTTTTAATTTTVAPSTSNTVPVTEDVVTASGPLSLPGYLAASYRLDGWFTESVVQATLNSPPDEVLGTQAAIYEEYVGVLRSLEPPPEAAEYHRQLLELMERAWETTRRAADAVDSGDPDAALEASEELIALGQEMVAVSFTIAVAQAALVKEALADPDDPESQYILALLALQNSESSTAAEALLAEATSPDLDLDALATLYRDLVVLLESTLADYEAIAPPPSWQTLYDDQIALLEDGIALYSAIADAIETGTEPELPILLALIDFAQRGPVQTAAVSEQMAGFFDRLEGSVEPLVTGSLPLVPDDPGVDPAIGMAAPEVNGFDFLHKPVMIENDGRAKAIVFLAHWCPHCQREVPRVQEWLDATGGAEGVDMYSVATSINPSRPNYPPSTWLESEGWSVPVVEDDADDSIFDAFGGGGFPFWVFVNADGTVAMRVVGETEIALLEAIIEGLG